MNQVYIMPARNKTITDYWYLATQRDLMNISNTDAHFLDLPNWKNPSIEQTVADMQSILPVKDLNENCYFVGHSVGCLAILHYLGQSFDKEIGQRIGGVVFVGGWFDLQNDEPELQSWSDAPIDFKAVQSIIPNARRHVYLSNNDPKSPPFEENYAMWRNWLLADVRHLKGYGGFTRSELPEICESIEEMISLNQEEQEQS